MIDHGRVIAAGTPHDLKARVGGQVLEARPVEPKDVPAAEQILAQLAADGDEAHVDGQLISVTIAERSALGQAVRKLDEAGIAVDDLSLRRPSLDEVFLAITGHTAHESETEDAEERSNV